MLESRDRGASDRVLQWSNIAEFRGNESGERSNDFVKVALNIAQFAIAEGSRSV